MESNIAARRTGSSRDKVVFSGPRYFYKWRSRPSYRKRMGLARNYLSRVYGHQHPVRVMEYCGATTDYPLVLVRNPLEALAAQGRKRGCRQYSAVTRQYLNCSGIALQNDVMRALGHEGARLTADARACWNRLSAPSSKSGTITLWELPASLNVYFAENSRGARVLSLSPVGACHELSGHSYYPLEFISLAMMLATEPDLVDEISTMNRAFINLLGAQIKDDSFGWDWTPYCGVGDYGLELGSIHKNSAFSFHTNAIFSS